MAMGDGPRVSLVMIFVFFSQRKSRVEGAPYNKGHLVPLHEVSGDSAPQEVEYRMPPQGLEGGEQNVQACYALAWTGELVFVWSEDDLTERG